MKRALTRFRAASLPSLEEAAGAARGTGRLAESEAPRRLARRLARVEAQLGEADGLDAVPAHELRKSLKKLRYEAELLAPAFPRVLPPLLEALAPLQEALGALHDADVRLSDAAFLWLLDEPPADLEEWMGQLAAERDRLARSVAAGLSRLRARKALPRARTSLSGGRARRSR